MKTLSRTAKARPMRADAYAGFLKLWLAPASQMLNRPAEVDAYLLHVSAREPLSDTVRRAIGQPTERAA